MNVDIVDVNNHDPEFQEQTYYFSIEENDQNADVGQLVGQVIAIDEDRGYNSLVEYYISTSNVQDVFTITDVSKKLIIDNSWIVHHIKDQCT